MSKRLKGLLAICMSICASMVLYAVPASAQTTVPPWYMFNQPTLSSTWPGIPANESHGANAIVVEGLYPCEGSAYSATNVADWTIYWANSGYQVVTEITPYANCSGYGSVSAYENEVQQIVTDVETYATNPGRYWGGIMLDEEAGYGFSPPNLESLNTYTDNAMLNTSGMSWYFTEDQPNSWSLANYNAILESSWPAPQAYTVGANSMIAAINSECSSYGRCDNLLTIDAAGSYSAGNNYITISNEVSGSPWQSSYWGSFSWVNYWQS